MNSSAGGINETADLMQRKNYKTLHRNMSPERQRGNEAAAQTMLAETALAERRKSAGLTETELTQELGVSQVNLSKIQHAALILRQEGAEEIYVFGSVAEGRDRPDSDLDLAVTGLPPARYFRAVGRLLCELGSTIDLVQLDRPTPFTEFLQTTGKLRRVG